MPRQILLWAAGAVVLVLGGWSISLVGSIFAARGVIQETSMLLGKIAEAQRLIYFNEVLTHSARLYAETGQARWKKRYEEASSDLRLLLHELKSSGLEGIEKNLQKSESALKVFSEIERMAVETVDAGDRQEGRVILTGPQYDQQKKTYAEGVEEAVAHQKEVLLERLEGLFGAQRRSFYQLYALAMILLILAIATLLLLIDRRALEEERLKVERELHHAQKVEAVGRLAAGVIHELKNPLSVILGLTDVHLAARGLSASLEKDLKAIREAGLKCQKLAQSLLKFSRKEQQVRRDPVDLNSVAADAVELLAQQAKQAGVHLALEAQAGLPKIAGDGDELQQVIFNLAANAIYAASRAPQGKVTVRTRKTDAGAVVEVEDNGAGIAHSIQNKIFDPFFTTKPKGEGTGLGLSICQGIANAHGGRLSFESVPGRTVFRMELPI